MEEGHISKSIPAGRLLALTAGGLVVATVVVFGAILPAEFNMDPLGIGKATGLSRLWAPPEVAFDASKAGTGPLAREYDIAFRTDTIEIPLKSGDDRTRGNELEYKVRMKKDATLIYEWSVADITNPEEFYYDFHGHTVVEGTRDDGRDLQAGDGNERERRTDRAVRRRAWLVFPEPGARPPLSCA